MSQQDHSTYSPSHAHFPGFNNPGEGRFQTMKQEYEGQPQRMQLPFPPLKREALPSLQQLQTMPQSHGQQEQPSGYNHSHQQSFQIPQQPQPAQQASQPQSTGGFNVPQSTFSRHRQGPVPASLPNLGRIEGSFSASSFSPQFSPTHLQSPSASSSFASSSLSQPTSAAQIEGFQSSTGSIKGKRKRASPQQLGLLNQIFDMTFFPSTELRNALGKELGMMPRTVQIWFQNRRQSWRAHKNRSGDATASGDGQTTPTTGEQGEPQSNDNERGGWEVLRSFQNKKATGEIGEYEYMTIPGPAGGSGALGADQGQSLPQAQHQQQPTSAPQAGILSGLTSPSVLHDFDSRWSSISDYGSSAPSSAGYLHHRSGSISSNPGSASTGTHPYGRSSPRIPSQQAWPRQQSLHSGNGHARSLSTLDLSMQAPPPLPYRQQLPGGYPSLLPLSPTQGILPPFGNAGGMMQGMQQQQQQDERQGYDYTRFGGLPPPPPPSSTGFGRN